MLLDVMHGALPIEGNHLVVENWMEGKNISKLNNALAQKKAAILKVTCCIERERCRKRGTTQYETLVVSKHSCRVKVVPRKTG